VLLCRWPSITEWEVHITAQGPAPRLRNDLYCVEWDVKLYYNTLLLLTVLVIILRLETYRLCVGFVAAIVFIENLYFTIKW